MQEKGNFEVAIRYYLIAIEVCVHSVNPFSYLDIILLLNMTLKFTFLYFIYLFWYVLNVLCWFCYFLIDFRNACLNSCIRTFLVYVYHMFIQLLCSFLFGMYA